MADVEFVTKTYGCGGTYECAIIPGESGNRFELKKEVYDRLTKIPYHLRFTKEIRNHGKMYTYEVDVPEVGTAIFLSHSGFGDGSLQSYVVTKLYKVKGVVKKFEMSPLYTFDDNEAAVDLDRKSVVYQTGNKNGQWTCSSTRETPLIYHIYVGDIHKPYGGYDK